MADGRVGGARILRWVEAKSLAVAVWVQRRLLHRTWRQVASTMSCGYSDNQLMGMEWCLFARAHLPWWRDSP